jgi:predicted esterase YcpF (UPF0227 family)
MIIYLHGFNSAGTVNNDKVIELQKLDDVYIVTYNTFGNATEIIEKIADEIDDIDDKIFVGTSLGGYFAAQLAKRFHAPAVLINPLFQPEVNLQHFIGVPQVNFVTEERGVLTRPTVASYKALPDISKAEDFSIIPLVIVAENDELIPADLSSEYFKEMIIFKTKDGGHRYNKPKQLISVIQNYLNQAFIVSDLNHE